MRPLTIPGMAWVHGGRSRPTRAVRAALLLWFPMLIWPVFAAILWGRVVNRSLVEPPLRLNGWARSAIRVTAYGMPFTVPLTFGEVHAGVELSLFLTGSFGVWLVLVLVQPGRLEQKGLGIILWFWLIAYTLPVWFLD